MARPTFLVTGATDGIGRQTAVNLAHAGARVLLHGRALARVEETLAAVRHEGEFLPVAGDFSSLDEVRALAEDVRTRVGALDGLIHNAGVYMPTRVLTRDELETTFQVNHLAPFLLTHLLLERLEAAPGARIVVVSSVAHQGGHVDFRNLQGEKAYDGYTAYALSKLANLLFSAELAERLRGTPITVNALHPGVVSTKLLRAGFHMEGVDVQAGAQTSTYLALSPEVAGVTGHYFADCRPTSCSLYVEDQELRERFWVVSEGLVGLRACERIRLPSGV